MVAVDGTSSRKVDALFVVAFGFQLARRAVEDKSLLFLVIARPDLYRRPIVCLAASEVGTLVRVKLEKNCVFGPVTRPQPLLVLKGR